MGWGIFIIKDPSIWHQISYSVCVNQNLKTQWPEDFWSPSYPVEFGKMNYIDLRPLKLKFPYIRMNCVCWWPLRQIVHSDVTGKVTEGFQLFICSLISLKSIKIPCYRNQCSQLLGQSWWFVYFLRPLDRQFVLNVYSPSITCFGHPALITCS